jgi:transcriptional regulator with XRE-family HTH domain
MDTITKNPQLSNRVRELRERAGMTLVELATEAGITAPMLSRLERGERALTDHTMAAIAKALGVSKGFILNNIDASGGSPLRGDFVEDEYEATLLRFWRSLSMDARVHIFAEMDKQTNITPRGADARIPRAVAK